jgi:recombination associated protein RdgC
MWFKNLLVYRITQCTFTPEALETALQQHTLQGCSSMEMLARGWVSPKGDGEPLVHMLGQQMMVALGVEKKLLPAGVINQFAKAKAIEIEEQQGYKPGRKQLKQIKEAVTDELLPRAFALRRNTYAWIDPVDNWLVVDAANVAKADELIEMLHKAIDGLALSLVDTKISPAAAMTGWLAGDEAPVRFTIDQDCELQSLGDQKATVRYVRHSLDAGEVRKHIESGKQVTRLAMTWNDKISFVLNENMQIKRLAPLDMLKDQAGADESDDVFDTDFAIMTGELRQFLNDLTGALGSPD